MTPLGKICPKRYTEEEGGWWRERGGVGRERRERRALACWSQGKEIWGSFKREDKEEEVEERVEEGALVVVWSK